VKAGLGESSAEVKKPTKTALLIVSLEINHGANVNIASKSIGLYSSSSRIQNIEMSYCTGEMLAANENKVGL
jgi:hypothetical protein